MLIFYALCATVAGMIRLDSARILVRVGLEREDTRNLSDPGLFC